MTDWFRSWHGAPTDPKWRTIAKRAGVSPSIVVSLAWVLLDRASQADARGSIDGADVESIADFLGCDADEVERVIVAMHDKAVLASDRFVAWEKRQPKRERDFELIQAGRLPLGEWLAVRRMVLERDHHTCTYCGCRQAPLHCDHVVPVSRGGTNDYENLTTACASCNLSKGGKLLSEWRP